MKLKTMFSAIAVAALVGCQTQPVREGRAGNEEVRAAVTEFAGMTEAVAWLKNDAAIALARMYVQLDACTVQAAQEQRYGWLEGMVLLNKAAIQVAREAEVLRKFGQVMRSSRQFMRPERLAIFEQSTSLMKPWVARQSGRLELVEAASRELEDVRDCAEMLEGTANLEEMTGILEKQMEAGEQELESVVRFNEQMLRELKRRGIALLPPLPRTTQVEQGTAMPRTMWAANGCHRINRFYAGGSSGDSGLAHELRERCDTLGGIREYCDVFPHSSPKVCE